MSVKRLAVIAESVIDSEMPDDPTIYSGRVPLAHVLAPGVLWLNGDGRTRIKTEATARVIRNHAPDAKVIIVPYAALDAAGINLHTIDPVDIRHDDSVFTAERRGNRAPFISSWDQQEVPPLYFLSQLPRPAATVDEALELLAPESVKTARDLGKGTVRQGDLFAIETDIPTRELVEAGATIKKRRVVMRAGGAEGNRRVMATPLFGTAHTATEVATMPDGRQYARGMLYHDPAIVGERRPPDHRRRKLGKRWHAIARNTVPVATDPL